MVYLRYTRVNCPHASYSPQPVGTATYQLAQIPWPKILQRYTGINSIICPRDSKKREKSFSGPPSGTVRISGEEELVSFGHLCLISPAYLFQQPWDVINRLFTEHIGGPQMPKGQVWFVPSDATPTGLEKRWGYESSWKLVLEKLCLHLPRIGSTNSYMAPTMGSPCSPVVANIYMEYFEKHSTWDLSYLYQ